MTLSARALDQQMFRRRVGQAVGLSLLVHIFVALLVAGFYASVKLPDITVPEDFELTIVQLPKPSLPEKPTFVETSKSEASPPKNASFESDKDSVAASEEAAKGDAPLPTRKGREQSAIELQNQQLALAQPDTAPPAPEMPAVQESQPSKPEETSKPITADEPIKPPLPDEIALASRVIKEQALVEPQKREVPKPATPPSSRPSFQRQTRATRLQGSVSNRGRPAVSALATPLGRYRKAITDAVGSSWYHHIGPRMDMFSYGTVSVLFIVDRNGKARRPRVISNTSNESFEIVTLESILGAEIPPIPPDVLGELEGGQIEIDFSFSIITD